MASALRRALLERRLSAERAAEVLADLAAMPVAWYAHRPLLEPALELRDNLSLYDAVYVVLAERLAARLVTGDARLARAVEMLTASGRLAVGVALYAP